MLRRNAIGILAGGCSCAAWSRSGNLDRYLDGAYPDSPRATAVLVEIAGRRLIAAGRTEAAARELGPPGSTMKPLVLAALIESGRLKASDTFLCPRRLRIRGRTFDCIHPELAAPLTVAQALEYSCNCFVAHAAEKFERGELARELGRYGLGSRSGLLGEDEAAGYVHALSDSDGQRMQALGEEGIEVTAAGLAMAYRLLALKMAKPEVRPIREGLEGAVEFGTAQNARIAGAGIAGKTGSVISSQGEPLAWFAGFLPSGAPRAALAVMLPGRSGGADAAPLARRIFEAYLKGVV